MSTASPLDSPLLAVLSRKEYALAVDRQRVELQRDAVLRDVPSAADFRIEILVAAFARDKDFPVRLLASHSDQLSPAVWSAGGNARSGAFAQSSPSTLQTKPAYS
jgi:hypothetical protein